MILLTLIPTSPKTKNSSAKAKIKKNTQARELSVSKSVRGPSFNCFNCSFINYFIGSYSVPVIEQSKPDKISGLVRHMCHMTSQPPSKQGHPVSTGSTAVKGTGFGVR